jgi:predicted membrane protein
MTKRFFMVGISLISTIAWAPAALADNVVVTPTQQPPPAVQPVPVQPAPVAPVVVEPSRRTEVHTDVSPTRNYVGTIAVSALAGGLTGALIGGAIYLLDNQNHPYNIAYWTAGGVLLGTGVGVVQVIVQENRASEAVALQRLPSDPARTMRLSLFKVRF